MAKTPQDVLNQIRSGKYARVYFLQGEEVYYIDKIISYIENEILPQSEKSFNFSVFYGKDSSIPEIIATANTCPMGALKVIVVKNAQELQDLARPDSIELIKRYLDNPQECAILAFAYRNGVLDQRTSLAKVLNKQAVVVSCTRVYDAKIPHWISEYASFKGVKIDPKAIALLQEYVGTNLTLLSMEIDKICINSVPDSTITDADIQEYVGISRRYNVFELQKAIADRDFSGAQQIAQNLIVEIKGSSVVALLGVMVAFFSKLLLVHQFKDKPPSEMATILQIHPFFLDEYLKAARVYSVPDIVCIMNYVYLADLQAKGINSTTISDIDLVKMLVYNIMNR